MIINNINPSGTITITENGDYDVTMYESASVNVSGGGGDTLAKDLIEGNTLTNFVIPNNITTIRMRAFSYAQFLRGTLTIPSSVKIIGSYAFENTQNLQGIVFTEGLEKISSYAFNNFTQKIDLVIPDTVTVIEGNAFAFSTSSNCKITIGSGVNNIVDTSFKAQVINDFEVNQNNVNYDSREDCKCLIETATNRLMRGCNNSQCFVPNGVETISSSAFLYCEKLTSITIPDSVTTIDTLAFSSCTGLTEINFGSGISSIGDRSFQSCSAVTKITITATTPPTLQSSSFRNMNALATIEVPLASLEAYQTATNWSAYADIMVGV